jgi:arylsulfatase A-like enzyme
MIRRLTTLCLLLPILGLAACGGPPTDRLHPLLDGSHAPDVLTENRPIAKPPATDGNRFLQGWWRVRRQGPIRLLPLARGARIEAVSLDGRKRELLVKNRVIEAEQDATVGIEVAGRKLGSLPLTEPLQVSLPADLPLGRFPITLYYPQGSHVVVDDAEFRTALPPGEVIFKEGEIVQSGSSMVDFVRRTEGTTTLVGSFVPPRGARADQEFVLLVERDGEEPRTAFEWNRGRWSWFARTRSFEVDLGEIPGFVRIRLLARGQGPAASWRNLGLAGDEPEPSAAPASPPASPRLVVLYVLDALRADRLGHLGGDPRATPNLDRMAAEGVTFTRHLTVAPNTLPSTKSLFTGQTFLTQGYTTLPAEGPATLAEVLGGAGYRTGVFSGNGHLSPGFGLSRGFEHHAPEALFKPYEEGPGVYNENAEHVHRAALDWLDGLDQDQPAFAYVHTVHPHNPYDPPEPFHSRFTADIDSELNGSTDTLMAIKHDRIDPDPADKEKIRALYDGGLAYNDAQIALFVEELKRRYPPEEILFIITSDHGEELFEHESVLHGYTLYEDQLRIPLIFWWPGSLEPRVMDIGTTNVDVHESLRALVDAPHSGIGDGRSLWPLLATPDTQTSVRQVQFAAASSLRGGIFLARSDRYKVIYAPRTGIDWGMGEGVGRTRDVEYVFDLETDPEEMLNLAGAAPLEAAWLRSRLFAWIERGKLLEVEGEEAELDDELRQQLEALGYLQ